MIISANGNNTYTHIYTLRICISITLSSSSRKLLLTTASADETYMPYHILVFGGDVNELRGLNELHLDL